MHYDVRIVEQPGYFPAVAPDPKAARRAKRANSIIVALLTIACTAMSIVDLALLAINSH
jgi:hypothetical protein